MLFGTVRTGTECPKKSDLEHVVVVVVDAMTSPVEPPFTAAGPAP